VFSWFRRLVPPYWVIGLIRPRTPTFENRRGAEGSGHFNFVWWAKNKVVRVSCKPVQPDNFRVEILFQPIRLPCFGIWGAPSCHRQPHWNNTPQRKRFFHQSYFFMVRPRLSAALVSGLTAIQAPRKGRQGRGQASMKATESDSVQPAAASVARESFMAFLMASALQ